MKQFLFFILMILLFACQRSKEKKTAFDPDRIPIDKKKDSASKESYVAIDFPFRSEYDSGYFKGYPAEEIDSLEESKSNKLSEFLSKNVSKKDIRFLNKETLSHSVFIDQKTKTRTDTLKNSETRIISTYKFGNKESQVITINGTIVSEYIEQEVDQPEQDILSLNGSSFRRFLFKGKEFYYLSGGVMDCGGSSCGADYYLLYDVKEKKLSNFFVFRVYARYFFGDINGDDQLDFLSIDNEGGLGLNPPNNFIMQIWSCNKKGKFELLKDRQGKEYLLEGNSGEDFYIDDSMKVEKSYWPVRLK